MGGLKSIIRTLTDIVAVVGALTLATVMFTSVGLIGVTLVWLLWMAVTHFSDGGWIVLLAIATALGLWISLYWCFVWLTVLVERHQLWDTGDE